MKRLAGVVLYKDRRVLLQHRDQDPSIRWSGYWAIFGGHLKDNEDIIKGLKREIIEELGITLSSFKGSFLIEFCKTSERYIFLHPLNEPVQYLELREGQNMALFGYSEIQSLNIIPRDRKILNILSPYWVLL